MLSIHYTARQAQKAIDEAIKEKATMLTIL